MKPLLMMRTRGITGPAFTEHHKVPGLSKSAGNAISAGASPGVPLGPELVNNGDASTALSGWSVSGDVSVTPLSRFELDDRVATTSMMSQVISFSNAKTYRIAMDTITLQGSGTVLKIGSGPDLGETLDFLIAPSGRFVTEFTSDINSVVLTLTMDGSLGNLIHLDNISIKELL